MMKILSAMLSIILVVCAVYGVYMGYNEVSSTYEEYEARIYELEQENQELEAQIFNIMTGEAYEVSIVHDDEYHTWKSDNEGIFKSVLHSTGYIN